MMMHLHIDDEYFKGERRKFFKDFEGRKMKFKASAGMNCVKIL